MLADGPAGMEPDDGAPEPARRTLPPDLPTSLDDRRQPVELIPETEMYDGWQGVCVSKLLLALAAGHPPTPLTHWWLV